MISGLTFLLLTKASSLELGLYFRHSSGVNCLSLHFFNVYAVGVEISHTQNRRTHCPFTAVAFSPSLPVPSVLLALARLLALMNDLILSLPCQVSGSRAFFKNTSSSQLRTNPKGFLTVYKWLRNSI